MTVYIVSSKPREVTSVWDNLDIYEGDMYEIRGVFATEEKARAYQEQLLNDIAVNQIALYAGPIDVILEEWEVN